MMLKMPVAYAKFITNTGIQITIHGFRYKLRQLAMTQKLDNFHDFVNEELLDELITAHNSPFQLTDMVRACGISEYMIRKFLSTTSYKLIKKYDVEMFESEGDYNNVRDYLRK